MTASRIDLHRWNWALGAVAGLGLALRVWGVDFGLPYTIAPDEPMLMSASLRLLENPVAQPRSLGYPHLSYYITAFAFWIYFLVGRALGYFAGVADLPYPDMVTVGVGYLALPSEFLLARGVSVLFGAVTIPLTYAIGTRLHSDRRIGLIAAMLVAVCPINIYYSHLIRPDIFALALLLLAFLWIQGAFVAPSLRNYVLAGFGVGLAASAKYNAVIIGTPLLIAYWLNYSWRGFGRKEIWVAGCASLGVFVATTPSALFNFQLFGAGLQSALTAQSGHDGNEPNSPLWYLSYLWQVEGMLLIFALVQIVWILRTRERRGLVLLSFPILYFIFISLFQVHNDRTVMLIVPFLALLAALFLVRVCRTFSTGRFRRASALGLLFAVGLSLLTPLRASVAADLDLVNTASREAARVWIESNLPAGARIAQEAYTPYLDPHRFVTQGVFGIADHPIDWYVQNGFEYLVLSQGNYGRFFDDPKRFSVWVERYNQYFNQLEEIKRFDDPRYEIRVYKTQVVPPANRVAVRFGNDGGVIELVGYERIDEGWIPSEPLRVKLFWRLLQDSRGPLELSLRLLGPRDQEIGSTRGALHSDLPGADQPQAIFTQTALIPISGNAAPGLYRLELNATQARYSYRLPMTTLVEGQVARLFLGPIKLGSVVSTEELENARPVFAQWGNQFVLRGYSIPNQLLHGGDTVSITLYWQALVKPTRDYTVFVHLLDSEGTLRAQVDSPPRNGAYPTSIWDANETIRDDHLLQFPNELAPGNYHVIVGLYEYPGLARLPLEDPNRGAQTDHWTLPVSVTVIQ